jgi:hypothetical protein
MPSFNVDDAPALVNVTVAVPAFAALNEREAYPPTASTLEKVSVTGDAAGVVVAVVVADVGSSGPLSHAAISGAINTAINNTRARLMSGRS